MRLPDTHFPWVFIDSQNIYYWSNVSDIEYGALIIHKNRIMLLVPDFEKSRASEEAFSNVEILSLKKYRNMISTGIITVLRENRYKGKRIGIDASHFPYHMIRTLRRGKEITFIDIGKKNREIREIKTKREISLIEKAAKHTIRVINKILNSNPYDMTEQEVKAEILYNYHKNGYGSAFDPIVASAKKSALPHAKSGSKKIQGNLLIDTGARYKGYCADVTRCLPYTEREHEIYDILKEAHDIAVSMVKPGVSYATVEKRVREFLGEYEKNFTHSLGHGVGLCVHEYPVISSSSRDTAKAGHVITLEPGIYLPGKFGLRYENLYLVTENGAKLLSQE